MHLPQEQLRESLLHLFLERAELQPRNLRLRKLPERWERLGDTQKTTRVPGD